MKKILAVSLMLVLFLSSCLKKALCDFDACAAVAPSSEIQAVQNYLTTNSITAIQHCSGLFYVIDNPGSGKAPDACSVVNVTYTGKLTNGTVFDQSTTPISFALNSVILGWRIGIPALRAGGQIHLYVPPRLGYGNQQSGPIPANSILIFDITLVAVQ
jgi:FKBP-type peptidyl-prolyl cis-trans isomerase FkpA